MPSPICNLLPILVALFLASSSAATARMLGSDATALVAHLKLDHPGELASCWDALFQLQSCSGEVVLFFMNGETQLGTDCCNAIRIIEHDCWPAILGTLGITPEESDILRGYCDATAVGGAPSPASGCVPLPRGVPRPTN